jgi:hypothetical protein
MNQQTPESLIEEGKKARNRVKTARYRERVKKGEVTPKQRRKKRISERISGRKKRTGNNLSIAWFVEHYFPQCS